MDDVSVTTDPTEPEAPACRGVYRRIDEGELT